MNMSQTSQGSISQGKIDDHSKGLGTVTPDMVEDRARQIALINGRTADQVLESDRDQARREMIGVHTTPEEADQDAIAGLKRWDEPPGTTGHRGVVSGPEDEETFAEQLVHEGVNEAEHDKMVESRLTEIREEDVE